MLSLERRYTLNLPIDAVNGCRNKFRYFPLSVLREVDIRFYVVAGAPGHRRTMFVSPTTLLSQRIHSRVIERSKACRHFQ